MERGKKENNFMAGKSDTIILSHISNQGYYGCKVLIPYTFGIYVRMGHFVMSSSLHQ